MNKSIVNPLNARAAPDPHEKAEVRPNTVSNEMNFIADECGDSLWDEVLKQQEKKKGVINDDREHE